jgi:succinyl-CoA synthetase beta subunit
MDLLEYQAKELFEAVGIPTLPSQPIHHPSELKRLQIPDPVVLKSQVRAGGRGRAGGIRFVENTIDAIAAAQAIFSLPILGEYPEVVLAEARYDAQEEFFLAVLLDYQLQQPVLLGSAKGGMDVEALLEHMQKVVLEEEFSPFHARRLAIKMGLQGHQMQAVSTIIEKLYYLFSEKDLDLVEINPLGMSAGGEVMALDGKIAANDFALNRHPELISLKKQKKAEIGPLLAQTPAPAMPPLASLPELQWLAGTDEKGNLGTICNSLDLSLATWDLILQEKGKLACALVLEANFPHPSLPSQLGAACERALAIPGLKVLLVNVLASPETSEAVAQAIAAYLQPQVKQTVTPNSEDRMPRATGAIRQTREKTAPTPPQPPLPLQFVVRLVGGNLASMKESLAALPIYWTENLEEAVSQAITLAKGK